MVYEHHNTENFDECEEKAIGLKQKPSKKRKAKPTSIKKMKDVPCVCVPGSGVSKPPVASIDVVKLYPEFF